MIKEVFDELFDISDPSKRQKLESSVIGLIGILILGFGYILFNILTKNKIFNFNPLVVSIIIVITLFILLMWFISKISKIDSSDNYNYSYIKLPREIKNSIQQYLTFFTEYVSIAKNEKINFEITATNDGLQIRTIKNSKIDTSKIQLWLSEYLAIYKDNLETITIKTEGKVEAKDIDILIVKLENQISHLNNSLKIASLENITLKESNRFLKELTINFSKKQNITHNHFITGGSPQYADNIENKQLLK